MYTMHQPTYWKPCGTPWGPAQSVKELIPGVWLVSTSSHGGVILSEERNQDIPEYMRSEDGCYEEDLAICIPYTVFKRELDLSGESSLEVNRTFRDWYPSEYERFYNVDLPAGASVTRDRDTFYSKHAHDYIAVTAWGSWHQRVPTGKVAVRACLGGARGTRGRYFLVPQNEYGERYMSFVIDLDKHEEITGTEWSDDVECGDWRVTV